MSIMDTRLRIRSIRLPDAIEGESTSEGVIKILLF
jgi:hypothetical protein